MFALSNAITGTHLTTSLLGATQATLPAHSMKWDPNWKTTTTQVRAVVVVVVVVVGKH